MFTGDTRRALDALVDLVEPVPVALGDLDLVVEPGTHVLACAVGASPAAACVHPEQAPVIDPDVLARLHGFAAR